MGCPRWRRGELGAPEGVRTVVDELKTRQLDVKVLVNNAGFGLAGSFEVLPAEQQVGMLELNVRALTALTRELVPGMVARRRGYVLNVASLAAFTPGPFMSVYYASKAYVLSFSTALHAELRGQGGDGDGAVPGLHRDGVRRAGGGAPQRARLFSGPRGLSNARQVAEAGYRGLVRGKPVVVPGFPTACRLLVHAAGPAGAAGCASPGT